MTGHIIDAHIDDGILKNDYRMRKALADYANIIEPWATRQSAKLLYNVQKANARAYKQKSKLLGQLYKAGLGDTEVGGVAARLLLEQVALIKSIPLEAGERAQKIAFETVIAGARAQPDQSIIDELKEQLDLSTQVATSRAQLIARTEAARASASINQARANAAGSTHYVWRTSQDEAVRTSHKRMQGKIIAWDKPPTLSDGTTTHAGQIYNCRCYAEPIFTDE